MVSPSVGIGTGLAPLPAGCGATILAQQNFDRLHVLDKSRTPSQDAQNGRPARPQQLKGRGVPSGVR